MTKSRSGWRALVAALPFAACATACAARASAPPLAAAAVAPGRAPPAGVPIDLLCIANVRDRAGAEDPRLTRPAEETLAACAELVRNPAFHVVAMAEGTMPTREDVESAFGRLGAGRGRLVFYTGHAYAAGERQPTARGDQGGPAPSAAPVIPLPGARGSAVAMVPLRALLEKLAGAAPGGAGAGWTVVVLNTCSSGFADVKELAGRISIVGSGYGAVTAAGARSDADAPRFQSLFLELVADGLAGRADETPPGNGDSIVTDREVADYVNARLAETLWRSFGSARPAAPAAERLAEQPVAVLRRQADTELPMAFLDGPAGGDAPPKEASLPAAVRGPARASGLVRQGSAVETRRTFLLLGGHPPAGLAEALRALGDPLEQTVVEEGADPSADTALERALAFHDAYQLRVEASVGATMFFSLAAVRGGGYVWAANLASATPVASIAREIVRHVPRRWRMYRLSSEGVPSPLLAVQAQGRVRSAALHVASWDAVLDGKADWHNLSLANAPAIPCPGARGQCFVFPTTAPGSVPSGDAAGWLVDEAPAP